MNEDVTRTVTMPEPQPDSRPPTVQFQPPPGGMSTLVGDSQASSAPQSDIPTMAGVAGPRTLESFAHAITSIGYEVLDKLGEGGMGVVWKARDIRLNRLVALKTLSGGGVDERAIIRFLAEAEAVAAVQHPHVVQVYGYGEADARPYMVLELCPGGSLAARLKNAPRMKPHDAVEQIQKIATGVAAAHDLGIIHRDLKPGNILYDSAGEPKVADFGLAKRLLGVELTRAGEMMGTPQYMAPEQAGGGSKYVGPAADVWALGVMLYECLGGVRPFHADTTDEILARVLAAEPAPLRSVAPDLPRDLELICAKALEKQANDRYPTAGELAADLGRYLRGEPISIRPLGPVTRSVRWARRNPVLAGAFAAVVVVTVGLIASLVSQSRQAKDRAEFERSARESAERLAAENATLAAAEKELARQKDQEANHANEVSDFLSELFRSSDPLDVFGRDLVPPSYELLKNRTARDFLDDADARFRTGLMDRPLVRARLLSIIGNSYRNLAEFGKARRLLTEAAEIRTRTLPANHPDIAASLLQLGMLELDMGNPEACEKHLAEVIRIGEFKTASVASFFLAAAMSLSGKPEALDVMKAELARREAHYRNPDHHEVLQARMGVVAILLDQAKVMPAIGLMPAIDASIRKQPNDQMRAMADVIALFQSGVATTFLAQQSDLFRDKLLGDAVRTFDSAIQKAEQGLPKLSMYHALFHFQRGLTYDIAKNRLKAEEDYHAAWEMARQTTGLAHPKMIVMLEHYPDLLYRLKKPIEARKKFDEFLEANLVRYGERNPWRTVAFLLRAEFEAGRNDAAAERYAVTAIAMVESGHFLRNKLTLKFIVNAARELGGKNAPESCRSKAVRLLELAKPLVEDLHRDDHAQLKLFKEIEANVSRKK